MNISVPRELKARMDAVSEHVNWSACAAQAFQIKLLEIERMERGSNMEDVIARMRVAEEVDNREDYQEGKRAGEDWVKQAARPKQMRALVKALEGEDVEAMLRDASADYSPGIALFLYLTINNPGDCYQARDITDFWGRILGEGSEDKIEDYSFACGFIEGAMGIWEELLNRF